MTICAPATATGGAIAVIRISGPDAIAIADSTFSRNLIGAESHRALYGNVVDTQQRIIDEVLLTPFLAPHSYTGEDSVEISCHGSRYIVERIIETLIAAGARHAKPGEFTQRAFLGGKMDLSQAEAVADLIASTNASQHQAALSQLRGGVSHQLALLRDQLLRLTSLLELELDFSDHEELEFADRTELLSLTQQISAEVTHLADTFRLGNAIKEGIPVAIIGAPNVGKSTLLNALLGEERAIVSDIQGTTRDIIEDTLVINGLTFRFIDTAGLRHTTDRIEQLGIERSHRAAEQASIIILLTEPGVPYPDLAVRPDQIVIRRTNKTAEFAALTGTGLDALRDELLAAVPSAEGSDTIITSARHHEALLAASEALTRVEQGLTSSLPSDLVAEDLRDCLHHLATITGGEITSQETLSNIFSHFCIGK